MANFGISAHTSKKTSEVYHTSFVRQRVSNLYTFFEWYTCMHNAIMKFRS